MLNLHSRLLSLSVVFSLLILSACGSGSSTGDGSSSNPGLIPTNQSPTIELIGSDEVSIDVGDSFIDPGATATDPEDGVLTEEIQLGGETVDTSTPGEYVIVYSVMDSSGASTAETRTVMVEEVTNPGPGTVSLDDQVYLVDASDLEEPIVALDDGDTLDLNGLPSEFNFIVLPADGEAIGSVAVSISGCVVTAHTENFIPYTVERQSTPFSTLPLGTCTINATPYALADLAGEEGEELEWAITVVDTGTGNSEDRPSIQLNGSSSMAIELGSSYTELGATASDMQDGDLTSAIQIGGDTVNTLVAGLYVVLYSVTDSSGLTAEAQRAVTVQPNQEPEINIIGSSTVYVEQNNSYADAGATASDEEDGDLTSSIITSSDVDTTSLGNYSVTYSVTDSAAQTTEEVRTVVVVEPGSSSSNINADIVSLTRVNGVSPETIYFSAEGSTCIGCDDIFGLDTAIADAYSELAYHFNFDDSNSGNFATTGNSRNSQVGGAPRAIHTFECTGSDDPNWDASTQQCEFDVGVRVQNKEGEYDDDFVRVSIQPQYGTGGYYSNENIYCVSSDSDYSECPHSDSSRHLRDTPDIGDWDGNLVLFERGSSGTYSRICMGADEQHATAATYGSGSKPTIDSITLASRPGSCNASFSSDSNISMLSDNLPERDSNGNLIDGYAFNQKVTGLRVGLVQNGNTMTLVTFHDLDMDWSSNSSEDGEFTLVNNPNACRDNSELSCSNMPYPMFLFLTDSVLASSLSNLATPTNLGCFNGCGAVNFGIAGVEVNRAVEHNLRMQGAWGLVLSNNWFRGNHSGGKGGKSRVTVRSIDSSASHSLTKDPENLNGTDFLRGNNSSSEWFNRYNVAIDNMFNQSGADMDSQHATAAWNSIFGLYVIEDGSTYITSGSQDDNAQQSLQHNRYRVNRNITWASNSSAPRCGLGSGYYSDGSNYNNSSDIHFEISSGCNTAQNFRYNTPSLSNPAAPGTP